MSFLTAMFSQIDLFGIPISFNFNGKEKARSSTGAWFTLLFIGVICWVISMLGRDLVDRQNPKTITSEYFEENPDPVVISPETWNIAFGLEAPPTLSHYINESIYTIEAQKEELNRVVKADGTVDMVWTYTPIELEICTQEHFGTLGPNFYNIELNHLFCFKRNQTNIKEISAQGLFESPVYSNIQVIFRLCNNQTSKVTCASKETMDYIIGNGYFANYFTNFAVDPRNYSHPQTGFRDSIFDAISNDYHKLLELYIGRIKVISDSGWITKEYKEETFFKYDSHQALTSLKPLEDRILTFSIRLSKVVTNYERSYIKVQDVIAQTNGIISAGLIVGVIILLRYSKIKLYEKMINELFDVKAPEIKEREKNSRKKSKMKNKGNSVAEFKEAKPETPENQETKVEFNLAEENKPKNSKEQGNKNSKKSDLIKAQILSLREILKNGSPPHQLQQKDSSSNRPCTLSGDKMNCLSIFGKVKEQKLSNSLVQYEKNVGSQGTKLSIDRMSQQNKQQSKDQVELKIPDLAEENLLFDSKQKHEELRNNLYLENGQNDRFGRNSPNKCDSKEITEKTENNIDEKDIDQRAKLLAAQFNQSPYRIDLTFGEYVRSFFWKSPSLKAKLDLLNEGVHRINERLNVLNILIKMREIDKIKFLLLENEQFPLFDALAKPELSNSNQKHSDNKSPLTKHLREAKFLAEKQRLDLITASYKDLKRKSMPNMVDQKLCKMFDFIIDT